MRPSPGRERQTVRCSGPWATLPPYSRAAATASFMVIPIRPESPNRLPSTKSAVIVIRGVRPQGWGERVKRLLRSSQNGDTRPPRGAELHRERCLENLFKQFAPINAGRRAEAQAPAAVHEHDLIRIFRREVQLVGDHNDGIAILRRQTP